MNDEGVRQRYRIDVRIDCPAAVVQWEIDREIEARRERGQRLIRVDRELQADGSVIAVMVFEAR